MKYVILSPYQADKIKAHGAHDWKNASSGDFDTTRPYAWHDTDPDGNRKKGRSLAVFFYDGPLSKAAAFDGLTKDSTAFADRVEACYRHGSHSPQLVSMAVDGETFGHHHKFGDMTLAHAFLHELKRRGIETVNYGRFLADHPPAAEVSIKPGPDSEGTAWSCAHGVRRWKGGCDCGGEGSFSLNWRLPLRAALNSLRDAAAAIYAAEGVKFFRAPGEARNAYADILLDRSPEAEDAFFSKYASRALDKAGRARALELLEMQKHSMLMFTSCGWFFSDISRIESLQNLRYAARTAETMSRLGFGDAARTFLSLLEMAHSNYPEAGSGLKLYQKILAEISLARQKAALAARLEAAGLESGFDSSPEASAALAAKVAGPALASPSPQTIAPLLNLLKAARDLGAPDLTFHLQNYLMELFTAAKNGLPKETAEALHELYSLSGIIIERFGNRLEELVEKR